MAKQPRRSGAKRPLSNARRAWCQLGGSEFILYDLDTEEANEGKDEKQEGYTLLMRLQGYGGARRLALGMHTAEELRTLKEFFDYVFAQAIPLAEQLDQEARQEWEEHGIDYARLYRVSPQFVVRERIQREHDSRVPSRPDRVDGVDPEEPTGEAGGLDGHS